MAEENTTAAVQLYLNALAGDQPAEPIIRHCSTGPCTVCSFSAGIFCTENTGD